MENKVNFIKMHGTGNDFVLINGMLEPLPEFDEKRVRKICDRRTGVGADGILIITEKPDYDFHMRYLNSDGSEGGMCGNGARCAVKFASELLNKSRISFTASDGEHRGWVDDDLVRVTINTKAEADKRIVDGRDGYFIDTGSPHFVTELIKVDEDDLIGAGRKIRYASSFENGTNVDFLKIKDKKIFVRTYERGVENETKSCGTGAVAVALVLNQTKSVDFPIELIFPGGRLSVDKSDVEGELILEGAVKKVFQGSVFL